MSASSAVVNRLAAELHRNYRAAEKALNGPDKTDRDPSLKDGVTLRHDHGWESCHKQKYFRRRAQTLITRATCLNPQTLGEAEQVLDSMVLIRRLIVNDAPLPRHIEAFMRNVAEAPRDAFERGQASYRLQKDIPEFTLDTLPRKYVTELKNILRGKIRGEEPFPGDPFINAIKRARELTSAGLKDSKFYIDRLWETL